MPSKLKTPQSKKSLFEGDFSQVRPGERVPIGQVKIHAFKGEFPTIATSPAVDVKLLERGDPEPMYITLAILAIDEVSENGLIYDEETVRAIEEQLIGAGGIRGHLGLLDFSAYPPDAIEWVGVMRDKRGVTWAKGYVRPSETREQIRIKKAVGATIGTSIFAYAEPEQVDENTWRANNLELITLDLVHPKRAALKMGLWSGFKITSETADLWQPHSESAETPPTTANQSQEENDMPENNTNTTQDKPQAQPEALLEMERKHQEKVRELERQLAENRHQLKDFVSIREMLNVAEDGDPISALRAQQMRLEDLERENGELLESTIQALVESKVKVPAVRPLIESMVRDRKPATRRAVESVLEDTLKLDYIKQLLRDGVREEMGPAQSRPITPTEDAATPPSAETSVMIIPGVDYA